MKKETEYIPKRKYCYRPWCGIDGKRCLDCVQAYEREKREIEHKRVT